MSSVRKIWWCLSWPGKRFGIWKEFGRHEMWLYKTKKEALEACKDWDAPPEGPRPKKIIIAEMHRKRKPIP